MTPAPKSIIDTMRYPLDCAGPVLEAVIESARRDMVGSVERTRQLYGRVLPIHFERAGQRADTLID